jgi:small-conductance mechanosensitive channel
MLLKDLAELLKDKYFGNPIEDYVGAMLIFLASLIALLLLRSVVLAKLKKLAKYSKMNYDDIIIDSLRKFTAWEFLVISLYAATLHLTIHKTFNLVVTTAVVIIVVIRAILLLQHLLAEFVLAHARGDEDEIPADRASATRNINIIVKVVLWSCGLLFVLNNLGVNITAAVAGMGIGGVAVALAAQSVLGDAFSSFAIYMDKPFVIGDFIIVGSHMGVVEHIGIKTTRVRSLQGEQLVFSNTDLTSSRIQNFKKMEKRRIPFAIGVTYDTPLEKLKRIPGIIKTIIDDLESIDFDRAHFKSYGDFSLNYEIIYYVQSGDYNHYMDMQQQINFAIKEAFERENIEFAFPTQTLFVNKSE